MRARFRDTLGNRQWMLAHRQELIELFPKTWTLASNFNTVKFGFALKILDIDWHGDSELAQVLAFMHRSGIVLVDGMNMRRAT